MPNKPIFRHSDKFPRVLMCVIAGATNCGKTHLLFKMLTTPGILDFDEILIFTTTPDQIYYKLLTYGFNNKLSKESIQGLYNSIEENGLDEDDIPEMCRELAKDPERLSDKEIIVRITKDVNAFPDPSKLDKTKKRVVIFDDCVNEKNQSVQKSYFTKGRHNSCCCFYLTQSFYGLDGQFIRKNANVFILFSQNKRNLSQILQNVDVGNEGDFKILADRVWNNPEDYGYIMININKPRDQRFTDDIFSNDYT